MKRGFRLLLALVATSAASAAGPQSGAPLLRAFVGEFEGTLEQQVKKGEWRSSSVKLSGRPILSEHYVELRGTFVFAGFEQPMELVLLWSYDPFQKKVRLAVLDDYAGLLDVFEQESSIPLKLSNVSHGTFFEDAKGRRSYNSVTVHLEDGALRLQWAGSLDGGTTWSDVARLTLTRRSR
jgi:hypothetical protein